MRILFDFFSTLADTMMRKVRSMSDGRNLADIFVRNILFEVGANVLDICRVLCTGNNYDSPAKVTWGAVFKIAMHILRMSHLRSQSDYFSVQSAMNLQYETQFTATFAGLIHTAKDSIKPNKKPADLFPLDTQDTTKLDINKWSSG